MSELPDGIAPAVPSIPRESASAVVLRRGGAGGWEVLLGLRSRHSRFMPRHLAFPGGGLEPGDGVADEPGYRRCASRELEEETGIRVGAGSWSDAGERITPPLFPVRFRTRFLVAELTGSAGADAPAPASPENESLRFAAPGAVVEEWENGRTRVPPPQLPLLRALAGLAATTVEAAAERITSVNAEQERAPRIEFHPGIWVLPVRTATLPPASHTNVWMPGGRSFVIIDPGSVEADEQTRLRELVDRRRAHGEPPIAVVLTHHHRDHAGGAVGLARELDLPLRAHAEVLAAVGAGSAPIECAPLSDGEEIDLGGLTLRAVLTEGHAPGHLAFHLPERKLLIAGDLVSGISTILIDPSHGDMGAYLASLERAAKLECKALLPGHGAPLPASELGRVIEHRRSREMTIAALLTADGRDLGEIAAAAYVDLPQMPAALCERQTLSHLLLLEKHGRARRDSTGWQKGSELH